MKKIRINNRSIRRIVVWIATVIALLFIILLSVLGCVDLYFSSDRGAKWVYKDVPQEVTINRTQTGTRYITLGDTLKQPVMFIHGAPGWIYDWKYVAQNEILFDYFSFIIVDRPGYGSTLRGEDNLSIVEQAEVLLTVIDEFKKPVVIVGHSYGSPVATVMAALDTSKVKSVLSIAGQFDPDNELFFTINSVIDFKIFKFLLPSMIWVSNREKLLHPEALRYILPLYRDIECPVYLLHGDMDSLVPFENAKFALGMIGTNARIYKLDGKDHALQMTDPEIITEYLLNLDL